LLCYTPDRLPTTLNKLRRVRRAWFAAMLVCLRTTTAPVPACACCLPAVPYASVRAVSCASAAVLLWISALLCCSLLYWVRFVLCCIKHLQVHLLAPAAWRAPKGFSMPLRNSTVAVWILPAVRYCLRRHFSHSAPVLRCRLCGYQVRIANIPLRGACLPPFTHTPLPGTFRRNAPPFSAVGCCSPEPFCRICWVHFHPALIICKFWDSVLEFHLVG